MVLSNVRTFVWRVAATAALFVTAVAARPANAATLCFDDPREVVGAQGFSCCEGGSPDAVTSPACGAARFSCNLEARCELSVRGDASVRIVDETTARPVTTTALLWAGHRCCADGTLAVRPAADVTAFSPQPLTCTLVPGCRVELEFAAKYGRDDTPDFGNTDAPFAPEAWEMFLACAVYGPASVADCAAEWLLPGCSSSLCAFERRADLTAWLEKVVSRVPPPDLASFAPVDGTVIDGATLFTDRAGTCCAAGTLEAGPFHLGGTVFPLACGYVPGCIPTTGSMLYTGDASLLLARADTWASLPAICSEAVAVNQSRITTLETELAHAETARIALFDALNTCRDTVDALRTASGSGTTACVPGGGGAGLLPGLAHDRVVIAGPRATFDLLGAEPLLGGEIIDVSSPRLGLLVWRQDGLADFFPHPGASGSEVLSFQVRLPSGAVVTATVEVVLS